MPRGRIKGKKALVPVSREVLLDILSPGDTVLVSTVWLEKVGGAKAIKSLEMKINGEVPDYPKEEESYSPVESQSYDLRNRNNNEDEDGEY